LESEPGDGGETAGLSGGIGSALSGDATSAPAPVLGTALDNSEGLAAQQPALAPQYATGSFTVRLSSGWRRALRELLTRTPRGYQVIYKLTDVASGRMLKVGQTEGLRVTIVNRFGPYATAGNRFDRTLEVKGWTIEPPEGVTLKSVEDAFRSDVVDAGNDLPWDNSVDPANPAAGGRLGRPGPGTPFVNDPSQKDRGNTWDANPDSPSNGMFVNSQGDPYPQTPDYFPRGLGQ